ncbi:hypothetical protein CASFOL_031730 [Castilleja foliolosa]|uniref:F-box domain-containing protein n=1 Tax=Castilleja foliolosa TaxID=1961234 RepID=A0ABD3C667_9LAMI
MDTKTHTKIEEEKNSQIADVKFKRCKSEMLKTTNIESLPNETIFGILVRVPAQDICNAAILVCRKWYQTICTHEFVDAHHKQSTPGLFIQHIASKADGPIFVSIQLGQIKISNINYKFVHNIESTCNGLILEHRDDGCNNDLCITNPATKQHFSLPLSFRSKPTYSFTLAYAVASKEYKLVCPFSRKSKLRDDIAIFTVGVDNDWKRRVNIEHLSQVPRFGIRLLQGKPLCTEGFVHWATRRRLRVMGESEYVLTLNIETEIVTQFPVPSFSHYVERPWYYYLSTGNHLTLLISRTNFSWEVWEMKSETGEWRNAMIIDLKSEILKFESKCNLVPVGWLNFGEVLVFLVCTRKTDNSTPDTLCIAYNVRAREIIGSFFTSGSNSFDTHRDSLVWLNLGGR